MGYVIDIFRLKKIPEALPNAGAYTTFVNDSYSQIYLPKNANIPLITHEVTHVIWHICEVRHMDFQLEHEHIPYLMQFIMQMILR